MFEKIKDRYKTSLDDSSFNIILESKEYKCTILCDDAVQRNYIFKRLGGKTINREVTLADIVMKQPITICPLQIRLRLMTNLEGSAHFEVRAQASISNRNGSHFGIFSQETLSFYFS